ncbi:hypothetical protein TSOC_013444 [Tetrabaena socialis]|uniref:CCHC-type domain-containing protein n=1 Tax=Tetrabaena socialis TaxID=47790 RepID=A0A2J7ZKD0_9CHLO|nr:hypothetical protein TSOC_013444 [Tetrabaena socialis]|eukprot:PNH00722.1 hypothetical protein TSOC_013444 [Tetrabaena socialis]
MAAVLPGLLASSDAARAARDYPIVGQLFEASAEGYKTAWEAQRATVEVNSLADLVSFKEAVEVIKSPDTRKRELLGAVAALNKKQQASLGKALGGALGKLGGRRRERSVSGSGSSSGSGSDSDSDRDGGRHRKGSGKSRRNERARRSEGGGGGSGGSRGDKGGGSGKRTGPAPGGDRTCYECGSNAHLVADCPNFEKLNPSARFKAIREALQAARK